MESSGTLLTELNKTLSECSEERRWNSLGYHIQAENNDRFLSTDFRHKEFDPQITQITQITPMK